MKVVMFPDTCLLFMTQPGVIMQLWYTNTILSTRHDRTTDTQTHEQTKVITVLARSPLCNERHNDYVYNDKTSSVYISLGNV